MSNPTVTTTHGAGLHVVSLILAKGVRAPLWLVVSSLLARLLEPAGLGTWSMILAASAFLNQLVLHWTQSITQRFGRTEWLSDGRLAATWSTRWPWLAAGMSIVLLLLWAQPFAWSLRFYGLDGSWNWFILPALLTLWLMAETQGLQQVRERFLVLAWSPVVADLVLLAMIGLLLIASMKGHDSFEPAYVLALVTGTGVVTWAFWFARELRDGGLEWRAPDAGLWRRATLFAVPLIPGFLVGYLAEWCDYFLIRHFYTEHEVGLFHPAYQYLLIMVGLPTALATVLLPRIVAKVDAGSSEAVRRLVQRNAPQFTVLWAAPVLLLIAVLPTLFAWLLGPHYDASVILLQVLLIAVPGAVVQHVYGVACFVQGRLATATLGLFGLKSVVNLALSMTLLPLLGVVGSAIGAAVSYLVLQWLFLLDQHRHLGIRHGVGTVALLACHAAAIALALVDGIGTRLVVATVTGVLLLLWVRQAVVFSREEVSAMIPPRLASFEGPLQRLLCRGP